MAYWPRIQIKVSNPTNQSFSRVIALIDSGASANLFTAEIADSIGIKQLETGEEHSFYGISGQLAKAYGHEVIMEVGGHNFKSKIYFSRDVRPETVLLGMIGFFDHFVVTFDRPKETIELKPVKK